MRHHQGEKRSAGTGTKRRDDLELQFETNSSYNSRLPRVRIRGSLELWFEMSSAYFFGARAIAIVPVRMTSLMPMGRRMSITALIFDSEPVTSTA